MTLLLLALAFVAVASASVDMHEKIAVSKLGPRGSYAAPTALLVDGGTRSEGHVTETSSSVVLPSVWGGSAFSDSVDGGCSGHIFAYSGLDGGPTNELSGFLGVLGATPFDIAFCQLSPQRTLQARFVPAAAQHGGAAPNVTVTVATNDVLSVNVLQNTGVHRKRRDAGTAIA